MDHLTPMGVAAAYLGELVTEELRTMGGDLEEMNDLSRGDDVPTKIVVVAPQEGQVRVWVERRMMHIETFRVWGVRDT